MTTYSTAENFVQPIVQYDAKTNLYRLVEDYHFEWGPKTFRKSLWMRAGFEWDFASVPRPLQNIARPDGPYIPGSMFHDRHYRDKGRFTKGEFEFKTFTNGAWVPDSSAWSRKEADELLEYVSICAGAPKWQAALYKWSVKLWPGNWFKGF